MQSLFGGVFKHKKVFVTGHTGFKGSWLTLWLNQLGATVQGYSIDVPTKPAHFDALGLSSLVQDTRGDIIDFERLRSALEKFRPDFVFHLAAMPIVNDCLERPRKCFETNVMGTINMLEAIREVGGVQAAIMITSDKCYENVEWEYGYRENDRLGGKDPYSASKAAAELAIRTYIETYFKDSNTKVCSVRAGNVIGGGDWARDRIVADLARCWSEQKDLVLKNPASTRPWQHVLEPLSGYLHLASRLCSDGPGRLNGEAFNFGPNPDVTQSVGELAHEALKSWPGHKINALSAGTKHESKLLKLSCDKAFHRLAWRPVLNFDETIAMTVNWYKGFYEQGAPTQSMLEKSNKDIADYVALATARNLPWAH